MARKQPTVFEWKHPSTWDILCRVHNHPRPCAGCWHEHVNDQDVLHDVGTGCWCKPHVREVQGRTVIFHQTWN
jgi:hypothetical protein